MLPSSCNPRLAGNLVALVLFSAAGWLHAEEAFIPLFREKQARFQGPLPTRDFAFRLPESIRIEGSSFILRFRASPLLMPDVSTATVLLNGNPVTSFRLPGEATSEGGAPPLQSWAIPLEPEQLNTGWNRVSVRCSLQTTPVPCRDVDNPACWFTLESGCGIQLSYSRRLTAPQLGRFPDTITEEQLLRQDQLVEGFPRDEIQAVASVLVPAPASNTTLRGLFVATARLGQPGYLLPESVNLGTVSDWNTESQRRDGILIGLPSDLAAADLPVDARGALSTLKPGEGLLMEMFAGGGVIRRWILVSGGDDEGLERAILGLGSREVLDASDVHPRVLRETPVVSDFADLLTKPLPQPQTFRQIQGGTLTLRGVFRSSTALNWYLPPGFETAPGSRLQLHMQDAGGLTKESAVQFAMNDFPLAGLPLANRGPNPQPISLDIPEGMPGRDPSTLSIHAYLDIGTTDCAHRNEERAWVAFLADSQIQLQTRPVRIHGLDRLGYALLQDAFLRRAAVLLPKDCSHEDLEILKALALHLGRALPSMPVLWPQAAFFSKNDLLPSAVVEGRSVLILGAVADWSDALPQGTPSTLAAAPSGDALILQGCRVPDTEITPSLVFAQFLKSPWSPKECVIAIGGLRSAGGREAIRLLTAPEIQAQLAGTVVGIDDSDRVFSYDVRASEPQSLAQRVRERVPLGLTAEETEQALADQEAARHAGLLRNVLIGGGVLVLVLLLLAVQARMISRRAQRRRDSGTNDPS